MCIAHRLSDRSHSHDLKQNASLGQGCGLHSTQGSWATGESWHMLAWWLLVLAMFVWFPKRGTHHGLWLVGFYVG